MFLSRQHHKPPAFAQFYSSAIMAGTANKRQKREDYKNAQAHKDEGDVELPKKKFYRQRAHANPFSDHQLT
jgi:hypothetical protein